MREIAKDFAEWILKIGKGTQIEKEESSDGLISIPESCVVPEEELISSIFWRKIRKEEFEECRDRAILAWLL